MSAGDARATLTRAATFWAGESGRWGVWEEGGGDVRARYTANCLRELDGFLRLLLDEVATAPDRRLRNTVNKLSALAAVGGHPPADAHRLRAIGRTAGCLFHCAGWVRRPDEAAGRWMTSGWSEADSATLRRYSLGDRLRPGANEVADICAFFVRLGSVVTG